MITYIKINDSFYPFDEDNMYALCGRCRQFVPVNEMNKNGYECLKCGRKRSKEYYRKKLQKV